jgi:hypothetical protein
MQQCENIYQNVPTHLLHKLILLDQATPGTSASAIGCLLLFQLSTHQEATCGNSKRITDASKITLNNCRVISYGSGSGSMKQKLSQLLTKGAALLLVSGRPTWV